MKRAPVASEWFAVYLEGGKIPTFINSYKKILTYYDAFDRLMPSHNEPYVEKELLKQMLKAVEDVSAGKGKYVEKEEPGHPHTQIRLRQIQHSRRTSASSQDM